MESPPSEDPTDLELQLGLEEIERSEGHDSERWLGLAAALLLGVALAPGSPALAGAAFVAVVLVATGVGFFQVRRGQRRTALESELERRRAEELEGAESTAVRLAALHDELDRMEAERDGLVEILLLALAASLFIPLGVWEGVGWVSSTGLFAGLVAALRSRSLVRRRREREELRGRIRALEAAPDGASEAVEETNDDGSGLLPGA